MAISGSWGWGHGPRIASGWSPSRVLDRGPGALAVLADFGCFWRFWGLFRIFRIGGDFDWGPGLYLFCGRSTPVMDFVQIRFYRANFYEKLLMDRKSLNDETFTQCKVS